MKIYLQLASFFLALHTVTPTTNSTSNSTMMTWEEFKVKFNKTYDSKDEDSYRMKIFTTNEAAITENNAKFANGTATHKLVINKFADLPAEEFVATFTGLKNHGTPYTMFGAPVATFPEHLTVPAEVNWVEKGAVTPVKDQGKCKASYAFSAVGAMEGQQFRKMGKLVPLSEQNVIDCSREFGNEACSGGVMDNVFQFVTHGKGINTEASYPYEAYPDQCRFKLENIGATFNGFKDILSGDENALEKAVATIGPISVAVDATNFRLYSSGIFNDTTCSKVKLNHGVLVVGYGSDNKTHQPYWLVKNSWGTDWGENGYIRIAKNASNMCGIATEPSFPVI